MEQRRCLNCMGLTDQPLCSHCGHPAEVFSENHQLPPGTVLREQYLVGRVLGQGGFGITYLGWDLALDRPVAIKEFFPSNTVNRDIGISRNVKVNTSRMAQSYEASLDRFLREARALAKFSEVPEIVGIYSSFRENGTAYIVMEFVKGTELASYVQLRGGRLEAQETLKLLKHVFRALDTVHKADLVHRDISPDNIILHPTGGAKILDFGAVRTVENPEVDKELNRSTEAIVKHGFAPIEQYRSRGGIGPWTDEYALCATVYYCLTGRVPPDAVSRSMDEEHPDWQSIPGLTDRQRAALEKGMSVHAKDRFPSVGALAAELYAEIPGTTVVTDSISHTIPQTDSTDAAGTGAKAPEKPEKPEKPQKPKKPLNKKLLALIGGGAAAFLAVAAAIVFLLVSGTVIKPFANANGSGTLQRQPLTRKERDTVRSVTFLDSFDSAPLFTEDVSLSGDRSVLKWSKGDEIFIAASGTIDGANSCSYLFNDSPRLEQVRFGGNLDTANCQSFVAMFQNCPSLTSVDLETLDTAYCHSFSGMFQGCKALEQANVEGWDMSKAKNLDRMFQDCASLQTLPVGNWDVSGVQDMYRLFMNCSSVTELPVKNWDTSSVTDMCSLFNGCASMTVFPVEGWDTSGVTSMASMFANCPGMLEVRLGSWNVANVTSIAFMFQGCSESVSFVSTPGWNYGQLESYEGYLDDTWQIGGLPWEEWFLQNAF